MKPRNRITWFLPRALVAALFVCCCAASSVLAAGNPVVAGPTTSPGIEDTDTTSPFLGIAIADPNSDDVTVTVTLTPAAAGALSTPPGVTAAGNVYSISRRSPTAAATLLSSLVFTPVANRISIGSTETTTFAIVATDTNGNASSTHNLTVVVTPVNNTPTIAGAATSSISDKQTNQPFSGITIADVDNNGAQSVNVTVSLDNTAKGVIANLGSFTLSSGRYVLNGVSPATASTAIRQLSFDPTENRVAPGLSENTTLRIVVSDGTLSTTNSTTVVTVLSTNDAPTISGVSSAPQSVPTGTSIQPFQGVTIADPDANADTNRIGQSLTLQVTMTGSTLGDLAQGGTSYSTNFVATDLTPADATAQINSLLYRSPIFPLPGTNTVGFSVVVTDASGAAVTNVSANAQIYTPFTAPGLSGTRTGQRVNDNSVIAPFSTVSIQSFNVGLFVVEIRLNDDAQGTLINLGSFVRSAGPPYVYSFTGTSEAATDAIRLLLFQPTQNRLDGSTTETNVLAITLLDGGVTNGPDTTTTVITTPVNDAPVLLGVQSLFNINDNQTIAPFGLVNVTDVDQGGAQLLVVSVSLDDTNKGAFTAQSLVVSGFTNNQGAITRSGTPAQITAALRLLVFDPAPNRVPVGLTETTTLTLDINDQHGGSVVNSGTQVRSAAVNGASLIVVPSEQPLSIPNVPPVRPFDAVAISDLDNVTVTVTLDNADKGSLSNSIPAGFTNTAAGSYQFAGTPGAATAAIRDLILIPNENFPYAPGAPRAVSFSITALDQLGNLSLASLDVVLRFSQKVFIVTRTNDYDPDDLGVPVTEKQGTLRKAIEDAGTSDHITFDLRTSDPGLPDYPAVIRLVKTLVLNKGLTFDGPGADLLTISGDTDGDGSADVQIIEANSVVVVNRLTLTRGRHEFAGGAIGVKPGASLRLSYCAVTDSTADVWGGGIDVDGGSLVLDHCLILSNSVSSALGLGGGGVSIYSDQDCHIDNTTFSGNRLLSSGGLGGGALYVENLDPGQDLVVSVTHCTFKDNDDISNQGSSIRPNVFNTFVEVANSIFGDGKGKNLEMDESGIILSLGGNISDDSTRTTFSIGGAPYDIVILDQLTDFTNRAPRLFSLGANGGPTRTHLLQNGSPAIGNAVASGADASLGTELGADQRGFWRDDNDPDIGAVERGSARRIIINEIHFDPAVTNDEFLEFYVPNNTAALNVGGLRLYVGGVLRHTFTNQALGPGEALVLFSKDYASPAVPTNVSMQVASQNLQLDNLADTVTLKNTNGQTILAVTYVGSFTSSDTNIPAFTEAHQSIVLNPEFRGNFLPSRRVFRHLTGSDPGVSQFASPGYDSTGSKPLAAGNATPLAFKDGAATDQNTVLGSPFTPPDLGANSLNPFVAELLSGSNAVAQFLTSQFAAATLTLVTNYDGTNAGTLPTVLAGELNTLLAGPGSLFETQRFAGITLSAGTQQALAGEPQGAALWRLNRLLLEDAFPSLPRSGPDVLVLANDLELDGADTIRVVSVKTTRLDPATNEVRQAFSQLGALVTISDWPTPGAGIIYDPRTSALLRSLPVGSNIVDTFAYVILDATTNGVDHSRGTGADFTNNLLKATAEVKVTVAGLNNAPTPVPDSVATNARLQTHEDVAIDFTVADTLVANDTDPDTDDNANSLFITSVHGSPEFEDTVVAFSELGALVTLEIRFNRNETHISYDPTGALALQQLSTNETIVDTFYYSVVDSHGAVGSSAVHITVAGRNDAPVANADQAATDEDTAVAIPALALLANDTDVDTDDNGTTLATLQVSGVSAASAMGASVTLAGANVVYDPRGSAALRALARRETAVDHFTCIITDGLGGFSTNDVSVTVTGVNDTPTPLPDLYSVNEDSMLSTPAQGFLGNDSDPDVNGILPDNVLRLLGLTNKFSTSGGHVMMGLDGSFTYDARGLFDWLAAGQTAQDTFSYAVVDDSLLVANDDSFSVQANSTNNVLPVLANDTLLTGVFGPVTILSAGGTNLHGTLEITAARDALVYTPDLNYVGDEIITYRISDARGGSDTATVRIRVTVEVLNGRLKANNDAYTVALGTTVTLQPLANDNVPPSAAGSLTILSVAAPDQGGTNFLNNGSPNNAVVYSPNPGTTNAFPYIEYFTYVLSGGGIARATGTVMVTVVDRRGALVVNDDEFTVLSGSGNTTLDVMANDKILPVANTNFTIVTIETNGVVGTVSVNAARTRLIYRPAPNLLDHQEPVIFYTVTDGAGGTGTAAVSIRVVPEGLFANPDNFTVFRGSSNNALSVLINDAVLPDLGQSLTVTAIGTNLNAPNRGGRAVVQFGNKAVLYTPDVNYSNSFPYVETFTYELSDGSITRAQGLVRVLVLDHLPVNTNPDVYRVARDSRSNVLAVLQNDYTMPQSGEPLVIGGLMTNATLGTAWISSPGGNNFLHYSPPAGFIGQDVLGYRVTDGHGNWGTNLVVVHVGGLLVYDDQFAVLAGSTGNSLDVLANDVMFPDLAGVRPISALSAPDHGGQVTASVSGDRVIYTPATGFIGTESFGYQIADDTGGIYAARVSVSVLASGVDRKPETVTLTISGVNDAPVIRGTVAGQRVYAHGAILPFAGVTIADVDDHGQQPVRVTVTLDNTNRGYLATSGGFVSAGGGVYTVGLDGPGITPEAATLALQGLTFIPTPGNRVTPTNTETTRFTIQVTDGTVAVTDTNTTVISTFAAMSRVLAADRANLAQLGWAVATTRDLAVVGAPRDSHNSGSGSVKLYARSLDGLSTWQETRTLIPTNGSGNDLFGYSVAISGDFMVVGAPSSSGIGAAFLFHRNQGGANQWGQVRKLVPFDGAGTDNFGWGVAISGDMVVVTSPLDDDRGTSSGSAYVYARHQGGSNQWGFVRKIVPGDGAGGDQFGTAVALSGETLVIGALNDGDRGANAGSAYVFARHQGGADQWGQVRKLLASDGIAGDNFGTAVAIDQDTVVIGAPNRDDRGNLSGAAYFFSRNQGGSDQWGETRKLVPADGVAAARFGFAVGVHGNTAVIGAPFDTQRGTDAGAIYLFGRNEGGAGQWGLLEKLVTLHVDPSDSFGYSVAVNQETVAVGSPTDAELGIRYGSATLFRLKFNNAPRVENSIRDVIIPANFPFSLTFAATTFAGPDLIEALTYSATLADGSPLPAWLSLHGSTRTFSGTPGNADIGSITVKVIATDDETATASTQFTITIRSSAYDIWLRRYFTGSDLANPALEASVWGEDADPDIDGLTNLEEYIYGTDPSNASIAQPLAVAVGPGVDAQHVSVSFWRRAQDSRLSYTLEKSSNFNSWQSAQPLIDGSAITAVNGDFELVTVQVLSAPGSIQFFRLRVQ